MNIQPLTGVMFAVIIGGLPAWTNTVGSNLSAPAGQAETGCGLGHRQLCYSHPEVTCRGEQV